MVQLYMFYFGVDGCIHMLTTGTTRPTYRLERQIRKVNVQ